MEHRIYDSTENSEELFLFFPDWDNTSYCSDIDSLSIVRLNGLSARTMAILILFFCSGATALVYEVIWSKYLALLFGSTIQAQTVVLAVFMGGLALGNRLFSRHADQARQPLAIYGCIEIAIGLYAFMFSFLDRAVGGIFAVVGSTLLDHSRPLLLLKGVLSIALLLGPTILMGGTFPILAAWLQQCTSDAGRRSARFYSINSLGAVCGAGVTGFWLVEWLGLRKTLDYSALVNVIIGLAAIVIGRMQPPEGPAISQRAQAPEATSSQSFAGTKAFRRACLMVALTGAVSMGLEVLASRCLCLIFGASLQVFSIVLMAFILGIGLGSAVIASPKRKHLRGETTAIFLLLCAATLIGLVVFNIENLVALYFTAESGLSRNLMGFRYYRILVAVASIGVLGLPAAALGSVLPLCIRKISESSDLLGNRVGRLLTWNTLGAVGGSLVAGFVLMPAIGLRGSFTTLATILVVAAVVVALGTRRPLVIASGAAVGLFVITTSLHGDDDWRYVLSAGIFRQRDPETIMASVLKRRKYVHLDFYEDAADATVSVERELVDKEDLYLRIDGKTDASAKGDSPTQLLLAYLPLMAKPESKDVFCFGMGSGITAGAALNYPVEHLTVAENCGPVLRAARLFDPWNNGVLTSPRARIYREDARTVLKLSPQQYDVIISEPSNPWMVGVGSVFTREFYQFAASRLKPGGIMAQWFHTYQMDDPTVDVVLRTFGTVFPEMEIWDVAGGDIVMLGSDRPWPSNPEVYRKAFALDGVRQGLASIGLETPEAVLARRLASQSTAFAIPGPGPIQGDEFPILEYAAPRAFYIHLQSRGVFRLLNFDERTWQMDLAPDGVNSALALLDPPALKTIFGNGEASVNEDLETYLKDRYTQFSAHGAAKPVMINNRPMPCSLQGTNRSIGVASPPSAATNMLTRQLAIAEYVLRSDPAKQLDAIASIENALDAVVSYRAVGSDWSPAYYADLAVKASLRASHPERARAILLHAMQLEPGSDQLQYLSRILLREKILQPADLAQAGIK
jgi:spermidine synthase